MKTFTTKSPPRATSARFEVELEHFRKQAESAVQFLAAYMAVNNEALRDPVILSALNASALYWLTSQAALQQSAIIALGRIFDQDSDHNLDKLIGMAQDNRQIFSKEALRQRKRGNSPADPEWLNEYIADAYEPTVQDFRAMRRSIKEWRAIYEAHYRPLRNSLLAHSAVIDAAQIDALHATTNIGELQNLLDSLCILHDALRDLYQNGNRLEPTSQRRLGLSERVTKATEAMLRHLARRD